MILADKKPCRKSTSGVIVFQRNAYFLCDSHVFEWDFSLISAFFDMLSILRGFYGLCLDLFSLLSLATYTIVSQSGLMTLGRFWPRAT